MFQEKNRNGGRTPFDAALIYVLQEPIILPYFPFDLVLLIQELPNLRKKIVTVSLNSQD